MRLSAEQSRVRSFISSSSKSAAASRRNSIKDKRIKPKLLTGKTLQWPHLPYKPGLGLSPQPQAKKPKTSAVSELMREKPLSRKATLAHEEVIKSRDLVFEVRGNSFW